MFKRKKDINELKLELKQKKITDLIERMLEADAEVHNTPLTGEYFVLDRSKGIYGMVTNSYVKVCNKDYRYEVDLSIHQSDKLVKNVQKKMADKSESIKRELFRNEIFVLDAIKSLYGTEEEKEILTSKQKYEDLIAQNEEDMKTLLNSQTE